MGVALFSKIRLDAQAGRCASQAGKNMKITTFCAWRTYLGDRLHRLATIAIPASMRLYATDYLVIALISIAAGGFIFSSLTSTSTGTGQSNTGQSSTDLSIALAAAFVGFAIKASNGLRAKNELRKAILADIIAISILLDLIRKFESKIMEPSSIFYRVRQAQKFDGISTESSPKQNSPTNASQASPRLEHGLLPATRHILEELTAFTSEENYFSFIDSLGPRISDLPKPEAVRRFYTLLKGSRDALRRRRQLRLFVFDKSQDLEELENEIEDIADWVSSITLKVLEAANEAIISNSAEKERWRIEYRDVLEKLKYYIHRLK